MSKKMLIDAVHEEETRIAVVDENKLVDYDYESKVRKQLKGSIFLAKVTRVEPSLQAAFVDYGGNRHGFLPFSEIHTDYYRIPVADREALLAEQEKELEEKVKKEEEAEKSSAKQAQNQSDEEDDEDEVEEVGGDTAVAEEDKSGKKKKRKRGRNKGSRSKKVETVGGDSNESEPPLKPQYRRNYKIQEVIKRGQIMLVQVSREERGTKGAAVTTYISLPGRYCVLMPNSPKSGGVSRKIDNHKDRRRMRDILKELDVSKGMSCIIRTAGVQRNKSDIKRDLDYLTRLWDNIRETTLNSTAPALIHEEGNLIRRSIRDIYTRDIKEIYVAGDKGYKKAKEFMKMMIPSHARRVKNYKETQIPLFQRYQVESQIQEMGEPHVTLNSGGYIVINPTEALVSIDVNSGRATKGRHIEETALKTNLEAAEEVARQLRLRDLGGLVVIDFIDMEDRRNNRKVENKLKKSLSVDRARIQVGRISSFGLLELSRQRLNPSLTEAQFKTCDHCKGNGIVRTIDSASIIALRAIEEEGVKDRASKIAIHIPNNIALYILNNKREMLEEIEGRYGFEIKFIVNEEYAPAGFNVEVLETSTESSAPSSPSQKQQQSEKKDEKSEDNMKKGTRRGKRGGRSRKNSAGNNNKKSSGKSGDAKKSSSGSSKPGESKKSSSPKSEDSDKGKESKGKASKKTASGSGKKKAASGSKSGAAKKPSSANGKGKEKSDTSLADGRKAAEKKPKTAQLASNDSSPDRDYETVNEKPKKKKTGWWSKSTK